MHATAQANADVWRSSASSHAPLLLAPPYTQLTHSQASKIRVLTFLRPAKERAVLLERKVDLNKVRTGEELNDHAGGDNGSDTELHEGAAVGYEDDTHPIEGVGGRDAVEEALGADEEDEEGDGGP